MPKTIKNTDLTPLMGKVKYRENVDFNKILNLALNLFFKDALRITVTNPALTYHFIKTIQWQRAASRRRTTLERQGIHVPPMMIMSITNRCNLHCKGCYNWTLHSPGLTEMNVTKLHDIVQESKELGISFIMIAGGEPLVRPEIFDVTGQFPEITFLLFTNGLLINGQIADKFAKQRNLIPVISLEGWEKETDGRRGIGVFRKVQGTISFLKKDRIFWSVSLTVTSENFSTLTDEHFIRNLFDQGCRLFFFVEYTPVSEDTTNWLLSDDQRKTLLHIRDSLRLSYPALFIAIPGDEDEIGGCLSAGRGFIHISASGDVEPCPFAPYSDTNLRDMSLKEALQSPFLKAIRDNHGRLNEGKGGCALWVERTWIKTLLSGQPDDNSPEP